MIRTTVIFLASLIVSIQSAKFFLIGGALADNQTEVFSAIIAQTGLKPSPSNCSGDWSLTTCPKIAVVTSAADSTQTGNQAYNIDEPDSLSYKNLFNKYGFSPKHVSIHIDNYKTTTDASSEEGQINFQIIKTADVIFFNGGDQSRHSRCWLDDQGNFNNIGQIVRTRIKKNQLIAIGTSAGTMVLCSPTYGGGSSFGQLYFANSVGLAPKSVTDGGVNGTGLSDVRNGTKGIQYEDNGGFVTGFDFVPFLADTHFGARGRFARIVPGMLQLRFPIGVGVDQSTCLFYDDQTQIGKVLGHSGVFIFDITKIIPNPTKYFSAKGIKLHYLTSGDTFSFRTNKVTSTKQLITKPYYNSHYDSQDILKSGQSDYIVTHLVDQSATYNIGYAKIPSYYPSSTPRFKFYFQKTSDTVGYYSKGKGYTAVSVDLQYEYE